MPVNVIAVLAILPWPRWFGFLAGWVRSVAFITQGRVNGFDARGAAAGTGLTLTSSSWFNPEGNAKP
jgi:hypothetical protein